MQSMRAAGAGAAPTCAQCCKRIRGPLMKCSRCSDAAYCNAACQMQHWPQHKAACKAACKLAAESAAAVAVLRLAQAQHVTHTALANEAFESLKRSALRHDHAAVMLVEDVMLTDVLPVLHGNDIVLVYACLARAHHATGSTRRATYLFEHGKTAVQDVPESNAKLGIYGTLALCYWDVGLYEEAMGLQHYVLSALGTTRPDDTAETMGRISDLHMAMGSHVEAEQWRRGAMAVPDCTEPRSAAFQCHSLGKLGLCYAVQKHHPRAYALYDRQFALGDRLGDPAMQAESVLGMGVARWSEAREQRAAGAGASMLPPGPPADELFAQVQPFVEAQALGIYEVEMRKAGTLRRTLLYTACLRFDAGDEDGALESLKALLRAVVKTRRTQCLICMQVRCDDVELLKCAGCKTVRFCSKQCQRLASDPASVTSGRVAVLHRDLCPLLAETGLHGPAQRKTRLAFLKAF